MKVSDIAGDELTQPGELVGAGQVALRLLAKSACKLTGISQDE